VDGAFKIPIHLEKLFDRFVPVLQGHPDIIVHMRTAEPQFVVFAQG